MAHWTWQSSMKHSQLNLSLGGLDSILTISKIDFCLQEHVGEDPAESSFQEYLAQNRTIRCPTCGQGLQKLDGCNHIQ